MKLIFIILSFFLTASTNERAQSISSTAEPIDFIKEFYTLYIEESSKWPTDFSVMEKIKREYCSEVFLNELESEDLFYDPILFTQDVSREWIDTIRI